MSSVTFVSGLTLLAGVYACSSMPVPADERKAPNIVYVMADVVFCEHNVVTTMFGGNYLQIQQLAWPAAAAPSASGR